MWYRMPVCLAMAALLALTPNIPAQAQANPAFFGTWHPAGDEGPDIRITPNLIEVIGGETTSYELVRDMGDRALLLEWPTEEDADPSNVYPIAYWILMLVLSEEGWYPGHWNLDFAHCGVSTGLADRIDISSREEIWDQLLVPNGLCELKDDGHEFGYGWGQIFYGRKKREDE